MTDQVANEETKVEQNESIFENKATEANDQKATSDQEVKAKLDQVDIDSIFNDKLKTITDEKGEQKYKDVFTAIEALKHSQNYIKTLEEENRSYRETKVEQDTFAEALNNISAKKEPETTKSEGIDAEKLKGMTLETLMEYEKSKQEEANKKAVSDALLNKFGDSEKAKKAYSDKANDLGIDLETFVALAAKSPKAVLSYFDAKESTPSPSKGSINTQALGSQKKEEHVDFRSRYFNNSDPSVSKWKSAGEVLNKG